MTQEPGYLPIGRSVKQTLGRIDLLDNSPLQDGHAIAQCQGFCRIMGNIDHCRWKLPVEQVQPAA